MSVKKVSKITGKRGIPISRQMQHDFIGENGENGEKKQLLILMGSIDYLETGNVNVDNAFSSVKPVLGFRYSE